MMNSVGASTIKYNEIFANIAVNLPHEIIIKYLVNYGEKELVTAFYKYKNGHKVEQYKHYILHHIKNHGVKILCKASVGISDGIKSKKLKAIEEKINNIPVGLNENANILSEIDICEKSAFITKFLQEFGQLVVEGAIESNDVVFLEYYATLDNINNLHKITFSDLELSIKNRYTHIETIQSLIKNLNLSGSPIVNLEKLRSLNKQLNTKKYFNSAEAIKNKLIEYFKATDFELTYENVNSIMLCDLVPKEIRTEKIKDLIGKLSSTDFKEQFPFMIYMKLYSHEHLKETIGDKDYEALKTLRKKLKEFKKELKVKISDKLALEQYQSEIRDYLSKNKQLFTEYKDVGNYLLNMALSNNCNDLTEFLIKNDITVSYSNILIAIEQFKKNANPYNSNIKSSQHSKLDYSIEKDQEIFLLLLEKIDKDSIPNKELLCANSELYPFHKSLYYAINKNSISLVNKLIESMDVKTLTLIDRLEIIKCFDGNTDNTIIESLMEFIYTPLTAEEKSEIILHDLGETKDYTFGTKKLLDDINKFLPEEKIKLIKSIYKARITSSKVEILILKIGFESLPSEEKISIIHSALDISNISNISSIPNTMSKSITLGIPNTLLMVKILIEHSDIDTLLGLNIDVKKYGKIAYYILIQAIEKDSLELVKQLCNQGVSVSSEHIQQIFKAKNVDKNFDAKDEILDILFNKFDKKEFSNLLTQAIQKDFLELVEYLLEKGVSVTHEHINLVLNPRNSIKNIDAFLDILIKNVDDKEFTNYKEKFSDILEQFIKKDALELVKYLCDKGVIVSHKHIHQVFSAGNVIKNFDAILEILFEKVDNKEFSILLTQAIQKDSLKLVEYLLEKGVSVTHEHLHQVFTSGNSIKNSDALLGILIKKVDDKEFTKFKEEYSDLLSHAIQNLKVELIKYLCEKEVNVTHEHILRFFEAKKSIKDSCALLRILIKNLDNKEYIAHKEEYSNMLGQDIKNNAFEIIEHLYNNILNPLKNNPSGLFKYLNETKYNNLLKNIKDKVAFKNNSKLLEKIYAEDEQFSDMLNEAIKNDALEYLKHLSQQGINLSSEHIVNFFVTAITFKDSEILLEILIKNLDDEEFTENKEKFSIILKHAIRKNSLELVKYLYEKGINVSCEYICQVFNQETLIKSSSALLEILTKNFNKQDFFDILSQAITNDNLALVKYLCKKGIDISFEHIRLVSSAADSIKDPQTLLKIFKEKVNKNEFPYLENLEELSEFIQDLVSSEVFTSLTNIKRAFEDQNLDETSLKQLIHENQQLLSTYSKVGQYVLHEVVKRGYYELAKILCELTVKVLSEDIKTAFAKEDLELTKLLITHADKNETKEIQKGFFNDRNIENLSEIIELLFEEKIFKLFNKYRLIPKNTTKLTNDYYSKEIIEDLKKNDMNELLKYSQFRSFILKNVFQKEYIEVIDFLCTKKVYISDVEIAIDNKTEPASLLKLVEALFKNSNENNYIPQILSSVILLGDEYVEVVKILYDRGGSIFNQDDIITALSKNYENIAEYLIAPKHELVDSFKTIKDCAITHQNCKAIKALINSGKYQFQDDDLNDIIFFADDDLLLFMVDKHEDKYSYLDKLLEAAINKKYTNVVKALCAKKIEISIDNIISALNLDEDLTLVLLEHANNQQQEMFTSFKNNLFNIENIEQFPKIIKYLYGNDVLNLFIKLIEILNVDSNQNADTDSTENVLITFLESNANINVELKTYLLTKAIEKNYGKLVNLLCKNEVVITKYNLETAFSHDDKDILNQLIEKADYKLLQANLEFAGYAYATAINNNNLDTIRNLLNQGIRLSERNIQELLAKEDLFKQLIDKIDYQLLKAYPLLRDEAFQLVIQSCNPSKIIDFCNKNSNIPKKYIDEAKEYIKKNIEKLLIHKKEKLPEKYEELTRVFHSYLCKLKEIESILTHSNITNNSLPDSSQQYPETLFNINKDIELKVILLIADIRPISSKLYECYDQARQSLHKILSIIIDNQYTEALEIIFKKIESIIHEYAKDRSDNYTSLTDFLYNAIQENKVEAALKLFEIYAKYKYSLNIVNILQHADHHNEDPDNRLIKALLKSDYVENICTKEILKDEDFKEIKIIIDFAIQYDEELAIKLINEKFIEEKNLKYQECLKDFFKSAIENKNDKIAELLNKYILKKESDESSDENQVANGSDIFSPSSVIIESDDKVIEMGDIFHDSEV